MTPTFPMQTDDGLDPINLIFTGYAPSWWVVANMASWSDSAYCSGPKTVNGASYNYTMEHLDPTGLPCWGPRDHIRIWDMGYSPIFGVWSIAAVHHEHTLCNPDCHHVIDSWNSAETDASSAFTSSPVVMSVSNDTLGNAGYYQGVYYNGNSTTIRLRPPSNQYPVVFNENGLGNQTAWTVTLNGTSQASTGPTIVFEDPDGVYPFNVRIPPEFTASPAYGTITVKNGAQQNVRFRTPWTTTSTTVSTNGQTASITFTGNITVDQRTVELSTSKGTSINFTAKDIGALGAVNLTIPRSIAPSNAYGLVYVNGTSDDSAKLTSDTNNYYLYFLVLFGTHLIQIQLDQIPIPYLEYGAGAALTAGVIAVMTFTFRRRGRKTQSIIARRAGKG